MTDDFEYDVFISYSREDQDVVLELAERLRSDGVRVWIDQWRIEPGGWIPGALERGLGRSRKVVVALSANASESAWQDVETWSKLYGDPTNEKKRFIPLRLDDAPIESSFFAQFLYVDWRKRQETEYQRLLAACRAVEDEQLLTTDSLDEMLPAQPEAGFYDELFDRLEQNRTLLLLAQEGRGAGDILREIGQQATARYPGADVLSVHSPSTPGATVDQYFWFLARECAFEDVVGPFAWEMAFRDRVKSRGFTIFLLSGFDKVSKECQESLAKILRGFGEALGGDLWVLASGGENLARQKYVTAEHSFLNHADAMFVPDLEPRDLVTWMARTSRDSVLDEKVANEVIKRYGAHPRLSGKALGILRGSGVLADPQGAVSLLSKRESEEGWFEALFLPLEPDRAKICSWLKDESKLGRFSNWPANKILRRLFWRNLLCKGGEEFRWRSETIRQAGLEILGCSAG